MSEISKEQILEEAQHLQGLLIHPGWKVIEDEVKTRMAKLVKGLVATDDDMVTKNLKANIRGLEFLLSFPHEMLETANRATEAKEAP